MGDKVRIRYFDAIVTVCGVDSVSGTYCISKEQYEFVWQAWVPEDVLRYVFKFDLKDHVKYGDFKDLGIIIDRIDYDGTPVYNIQFDDGTLDNYIPEADIELNHIKTVRPRIS